MKHKNKTLILTESTVSSYWSEVVTVLAWYQGTGIWKSDCKQPLRIEIIRALNECTGRLFRAATRHNHKSSDIQSKKISNDQEVPALDSPLLHLHFSTYSVCPRYRQYKVHLILPVTKDKLSSLLETQNYINFGLVKTCVKP